jgi:hypothetical protein
MNTPVRQRLLLCIFMICAAIWLSIGLLVNPRGTLIPWGVLAPVLWFYGIRQGLGAWRERRPITRSQLTKSQRRAD